jgi:hypothetical protein
LLVAAPTRGYAIGPLSTADPLMHALPTFMLAQTTIDHVGNLDLLQVAGAIFVGFVLLQFALYTLLYRKPRIDEALVRTGLWDARVAIGSGLLVLPMVHTIRRVCLAHHTLTVEFTGDRALRWQGGERYEGHAIITVQVPPESPSLIMAAASKLTDTFDPDELLRVLIGAYRSSCRDTLREFKRLSFELEPASVEVRLTRALDLTSAAFGLRVRAVHLHGSVADSAVLRRTLARLDTLTDQSPTEPPAPDRDADGR